MGPNAGITIVGGHELAETGTDQFPSSGWLDSSGSENGDKCAWIRSGQGAAAYDTFPNSTSFPVQSLWSNAFSSNSGGCVLAFQVRRRLRVENMCRGRRDDYRSASADTCSAVMPVASLITITNASGLTAAIGPNTLSPTCPITALAGLPSARN